MKQALIQRTVETLSKLPEDKIEEISDFADFILKKYDEKVLQKGMESIMGESNTFDFLKEEPISYSVKDLKKRY
ncbi:MAG: hypothetical protein WA913_04440 [Pricia sp.]